MTGSQKIYLSLKKIKENSNSDFQVYFSYLWFERNLQKNAELTFLRYDLHRTPNKNGILLYMNPRIGKFAIIHDSGFLELLDPRYWEMISALLRKDLLSTHIENALTLTIKTIGVSLKKHFPH